MPDGVRDHIYKFYREFRRLHLKMLLNHRILTKSQWRRDFFVRERIAHCRGNRIRFEPRLLPNEAVIRLGNCDECLAVGPVGMCCKSRQCDKCGGDYVSARFNGSCDQPYPMDLLRLVHGKRLSADYIDYHRLVSLSTTREVDYRRDRYEPRDPFPRWSNVEVSTVLWAMRDNPLANLLRIQSVCGFDQPDVVLECLLQFVKEKRADAEEKRADAEERARILADAAGKRQRRNARVLRPGLQRPH